MKTKVSVESVTSELDLVRDGALASEQFGAAHAAVVSKAKLHGIMIDRKETGAPGDFAGVQTAEELLALAKEQLGDEIAGVLAAIYAKREAEALPGNACGAAIVESIDVFPDLGKTPTEGNA